MAEEDNTFTLEDEEMDTEVVAELDGIGDWLLKKCLNRKEAIALYEASRAEMMKLIAISQEKGYATAGFSTWITQVEGYNRWKLRGVPTRGYVMSLSMSPGGVRGPDTIYVRFFLYGNELGQVVGVEKLEEIDGE
jgi:hypothetical protein